MRILLSEGASTSARQAITVLGLNGYDIEVSDHRKDLQAAIHELERNGAFAEPVPTGRADECVLCWTRLDRSLAARIAWRGVLRTGSSQQGVRTHSEFQALLGCAIHEQRRSRLLRDCCLLLTKRPIERVAKNSLLCVGTG